MGRQLRFLLLWEGEAADRIRDRLMAKLPAAWGTAHGVRNGWTIELVNVQQLSSPASKSFLDDVHTFAKDCDYAIALQAPDARPASAGAGNLWLEVGIWITRNGRDRLILTSQQPRRAPKNGKPTGTRTTQANVRLPSNFAGTKQIRYKSDAQLLEQLMRWFVQLFTQDRERATLLGDYPSAPPPAAISSDAVRVERVRATFGEEAAQWLGRHIQLCKEAHGQSCDCSSDALTFTAELLRMGKAARELSDVSEQLLRIGDAAYTAADGPRIWSAPSDVRSQREIERQALRNLMKELTRLANMADHQLRRRAEEPQAPWLRIQSFLGYRLERFISDTIDTQELSQMLEVFIGRAMEYTDPRVFRSPLFMAPDGLSQHDRDSMLWFAGFAKRLAGHLELLRIRWFDITSETMKAHFRQLNGRPHPRLQGIQDPAMTSLASTIQQLGELSRALPHNCDRWPVPVWPSRSHTVGKA
jgi:hypothetical protein